MFGNGSFFELADCELGAECSSSKIIYFTTTKCSFLKLKGVEVALVLRPINHVHLGVSGCVI